MPPVDPQRIEPTGIYHADQLAELLGFKLTTVQGWFRSKRLQGVRTGNVGGGWMTSGESVLTFLAGQKPPD
jgi:hypothetical protein